VFAFLSPMLLRLVGVALVLAAITAAVLGYGHSRYNKGVAVTTAAYEAALSKQKVGAAQLLAEATEKVLVFERKLAAERAAQEVKDAANKKLVADLGTRLRAVGLRDPGATGCRESGGGTESTVAASPGDRPANTTEGTGVLSQQFTDLLLAQASEADAINLAYISCRADAFSVREVPRSVP